MPDTAFTPLSQRSTDALEKEIAAMFERLQDSFLKRTDGLLADLLSRQGRQFALLIEGLLKQTFDGPATAEGTPRGGFTPSTLQNLSGLWQELQRAQRNL